MNSCLSKMYAQHRHITASQQLAALASASILPMEPLYTPKSPRKRKSYSNKYNVMPVYSMRAQHQNI